MSINLAEAATRLFRNGLTPGVFVGDIEEMSIEVASFDTSHALTTATLEPETRQFGLSLGNRACLALVMSRKMTVYITDRVWANLDLGIKIMLIR